MGLGVLRSKRQMRKWNNDNKEDWISADETKLDTLNPTLGNKQNWKRRQYKTNKTELVIVKFANANICIFYLSHRPIVLRECNIPENVEPN